MRCQQSLRFSKIDDRALAQGIEEREQNQEGAGYTQPATDPDQIETMQQQIGKECRQHQGEEKRREGYYLLARE